MEFKIDSMEHEMNDMFRKRKEEIDARKAEIENELEIKVLKLRTKYLILEFVTAIVGYSILLYTLGFLATVGIWLVLWGNNLAMVRTDNTEKTFLLKEIWKYKK